MTEKLFNDQASASTIFPSVWVAPWLGIAAVDRQTGVDGGLTLTLKALFSESPGKSGKQNGLGESGTFGY